MSTNDEPLPEEVSKQAYRKKVWDYLEANNLAHFPRPVHGRIPNFKGSPEAAHELAKLDVFKSASTIKVNPDKPQDTVRFLALEAGKTILVPIPRLRTGFFQRVDPPPRGSKQDIKLAASRRGAEQFGKPLGLDANVKVDLVVLGSVAVSEEGYRIGKGEGYADLEFAMMMGMGAVNEDTYVVSTVHDCQVFDTLPKEIFKEHDVPVDIIVTPTQVIRVSQRLPKPKGIIWSILSSRRLKEMPILQELREREMAEGKDCTLKEVDSDIEEPPPRVNARGEGRNRFRKRRPQLTKASSEEGAGEESRENGVGGSRPSRTFRRRRNPGKKPVKSTTEENTTSDDVPNENEAPVSKKVRRPALRLRQRPHVEFSLRVDNIAPDVRVRDLKAALAERGVKPSDITWCGHRGYAFLHFAKTGQAATVNAPVGVDSIVASLRDMKLGTEGGGENVKIEPANHITRIEVTDISSV
ncbi:methenyltetrahydrofolate synthase domain-containing protein [Anabrus simplex]|uniref:methenyltetrahydrofolate synthase domain-containing protein n=1 Tax=Anabrus simplex TaxID=316456 RepID=UPI0034DD1E8F